MIALHLEPLRVYGLKGQHAWQLFITNCPPQSSHKVGSFSWPALYDFRLPQGAFIIGLGGVQSTSIILGTLCIKSILNIS